MSDPGAKLVKSCPPSPKKVLAMTFKEPIRRTDTPPGCRDAKLSLKSHL